MAHKKGQAGVIIFFIVMILLVVVAILFSNTEYTRLLQYRINGTNESNETNESVIIDTGNPLTKVTVASWNLQVFGRTKASSQRLMDYYVDKIDDYDVVIIQEIRDKTGEAFEDLCARLPEYKCEVSSRAGRSTSKEQYGVIYKDFIHLKQFSDYNPDSKDRWERPPLKFILEMSNYELVIYTIHTKPDDATYEIQMLEYLVEDQGNAVIMGDLNADCSYYSRSRDPTFEDWIWLIDDNADTTSSSTKCAYDRILINGESENYVWSHGIMDDVTPEQSDHYLVWVTFEG